ncbi:MAG: hypothetical protein ACRD9Y_14535 [Blastocatellia bacterium]
MARALPFQLASQVRRFDMRDELNRQFLKNERFLLRSSLFRLVAMEEKKWSSPLPALEYDTRLDKGGYIMMKAVKKIVFALFVSSVLAFNGLAQNGDYWQRKPKEDKPIERPKEAPKKDNEGRGGEKKGGDKKKEKKPDGGDF